MSAVVTIRWHRDFHWIFPRNNWGAASGEGETKLHLKLCYSCRTKFCPGFTRYYVCFWAKVCRSLEVASLWTSSLDLNANVNHLQLLSEEPDFKLNKYICKYSNFSIFFKIINKYRRRLQESTIKKGNKYSSYFIYLILVIVKVIKYYDSVRVCVGGREVCRDKNARALKCLIFIKFGNCE